MSGLNWTFSSLVEVVVGGGVVSDPSVHGSLYGFMRPGCDLLVVLSSPRRYAHDAAHVFDGDRLISFDLLDPPVDINIALCS